jgi:hypothetical protein
MQNRPYFRTDSLLTRSAARASSAIEGRRRHALER